ncbi:MAG: hypothetical protein HXS41_14980 [Theionarchaea archaeon]|nr:hypothetical protein [Theionarchaea archaeon]
MRRLVRNRVAFSAIDLESVINVRKNLEELGPTDIVYYRSTFPPLFPEQRAVRETQISESENSNHIEILLNGVTIARFFNGPRGGTPYDENI